MLNSSWDVNQWVRALSTVYPNFFPVSVSFTPRQIHGRSRPAQQQQHPWPFPTCLAAVAPRRRGESFVSLEPTPLTRLDPWPFPTCLAAVAPRRRRESFVSLEPTPLTRLDPWPFPTCLAAVAPRRRRESFVSLEPTPLTRCVLHCCCCCCYCCRY